MVLFVLPLLPIQQLVFVLQVGDAHFHFMRCSSHNSPWGCSVAPRVGCFNPLSRTLVDFALSNRSVDPSFDPQCILNIEPSFWFV